MQLAGLAATAAPSTVIGPGDSLEVTLLSGAEEEPVSPHAVRVADDGTIDLPIVGQVAVAGVEPFVAERLIAQAAISRGLFHHPNVHVEVPNQATRRITVLGAVNSPGTHEVPAGACTVVAALAAAGGLTEDAGLEVELVRQSSGGFLADSASGKPSADGVELASYQGDSADVPVTERLNLAKRDTHANKKQLSDGDVVMVLPKEKRAVYVSGLVNRPDQFDLPDDQDLRVLDALALAGGRSSSVADRVLVIRQRDDAPPAVIQVSVRNAKSNGPDNLVLAPGDLVSVESSVATSVLEAARTIFRVTVGTGTGIRL